MGICTPANLSKIENNHQNIRLKEYVAIMERLGLDVTPIGIPVSPEELERYNLELRIQHCMAVDNWDVDDMIERYIKCGPKLTVQGQQFVTMAQVLVKKQRGEDAGAVMEMLLKAIRYSYKKFDIDNIGNVKLLTNYEITIIQNIANILDEQGDTEKAIKWGFFLKEYLERRTMDYDAVTKSYPLVLFNLTNWIGKFGRYEEGLELCEIGLDYCNRHGKLNMFTDLLYNKGRYLGALGKREEVIKCFSYAYMIFDVRGDKKRAGTARNLLDKLGVKSITL